jgi:hypothetical protein
MTSTPARAINSSVGWLLWGERFAELPHRVLRGVEVVSPFFEPDAAANRAEDPTGQADDDSIFRRLFSDFEFEPDLEAKPVTVFFQEDFGATALPVTKLKTWKRMLHLQSRLATSDDARRLHGKLIVLEGSGKKGREPFLVALHGSPIRHRTGRCQQPLFLLRAVRCGAAASEEKIAAWVAKELVRPVKESLSHITDHYFSEVAESSVEDDNRLETAEQEAVFLLEDSRSVDLVGHYDGSNSRDREAHRRNFNDYYNPFVLLVSRVGEEGIDLQKQCRYVIHYDLEWNPAKMEQREGRVDRVGWMERNGSGTVGKERQFIDVRFMLLKGTYEARIFHTVMLRDQWFQILIGSKRRELGEIKPDNEDDSGASSEVEGPQVEDDLERGRLTKEEKERVMLDLRPRPPSEDRQP